MYGVRSSSGGTGRQVTLAEWGAGSAAFLSSAFPAGIVSLGNPYSVPVQRLMLLVEGRGSCTYVVPHSTVIVHCSMRQPQVAPQAWQEVSVLVATGW